MLLNRRNKIKEKLHEDFGELKDDPFDFEQIEAYFRKKDHASAFQVLSDKTCNDLDFQELFMYLDRTNSKVGQQVLYNKLRAIGTDRNELSRNEVLVEQFTTNPAFRVEIQYLLLKLKEKEAFYISTLFQEEHLKKPSWFGFIWLLSLVSTLSAITLFFIPKMFIVFLVGFIINLAVHYWNKRNLYQYFGSIPQLQILNDVAKEFLKHDCLKNTTPDLSESIRLIDKVRNRSWFFNLEVKLQGDFEIIFWGVLEFFKIMVLLEPILLFGILKQLDTKRKEIEELFVFVGNIDTLISIASLRKGLREFCIPTIEKHGKVLEMAEAYHPLIPDCVANTMLVADKSILLTGSNMSGKTSFIRTIGINVITGLTINTCFAEQCRISKMNVFSAIRISDDLMNDKSYYFEEVLTIKNMIDSSNSGTSNLFLLDEIFKGTNTVERISAGKAVLSYLNKNDNIVFVSTHDIELADLLKAEYALYHFSEIVDHQTVDFDYKLKEGKLKNRNAIRILQINDYPESIIDEAIEISKELDEQRVGGITKTKFHEG